MAADEIERFFERIRRPIIVVAGRRSDRGRSRALLRSPVFCRQIRSLNQPRERIPAPLAEDAPSGRFFATAKDMVDLLFSRGISRKDLAHDRHQVIVDIGDVLIGCLGVFEIAVEPILKARLRSAISAASDSTRSRSASTPPCQMKSLLRPIRLLYILSKYFYRLFSPNHRSMPRPSPRERDMLGLWASPGSLLTGSLVEQPQPLLTAHLARHLRFAPGPIPPRFEKLA